MLKNHWFMLEDVRQTGDQAPPSESAVVKKAAVVTPFTDTGETTVSIPLRKSRTDDREQDKENDVRAVQATQAVIQRRRRPKRRSTGVVHVDMDEIDPERQSDSNSAATGSGDTDDSLSINNSESGGEQSERSRVASESSSPEEVNKEERGSETKENGEIDYKKLYEEQLEVNERLKDKLRVTEEDLAQAKLAEKNATAPSRNSLSEAERRERRAMERKLSEMEEELKHLAFLKSENQRLKDENGALIRVISKLSK